MASCQRRAKPQVVAGHGCVEVGAPEGAPVFYCHGYPGSRLEAALFDEAATAEHVRLISLDRPGMGLTPFAPGFRVDDWPARVVAVADALGIDRFAVLGVSGGAPYAVACGAALAARVSGIVLGCPAVPYALLRGQVGFPFAQMDSLYGRAPDLLRLSMRALAPALRHLPNWLVQPPPVGCPPADREVLSRADVREKMARSVRATWQQGGAAVFADGERLRSNEGIELATLQVPVAVMHGTQDQIIALECVQRWCGNAPGVALQVSEGDGHFSLAFGEPRRLFKALPPLR